MRLPHGIRGNSSQFDIPTNSASQNITRREDESVPSYSAISEDRPEFGLTDDSEVELSLTAFTPAIRRHPLLERAQSCDLIRIERAEPWEYYITHAENIEDNPEARSWLLM